MKQIIKKINKTFESRIRLGIMSVLLVRDSVDFNNLKELLDTSDGNLATHIAALDKHKFISIQKKFIGKKPNTSYRVTKLGKQAFKKHLDALEKLIGKK